MKIGKNKILALSLALLITLPIAAMSLPKVNADDSEPNVEVGPVEPVKEGSWYKFETPLITLIFPAMGTKPIFLWWYTNDNSTIYVVKFQGVIEYLTFDLPYYDRRYPADNLTLQQILQEEYIEPKLSGFRDGWRQQLRKTIMDRLMLWLIGFHSPYLPFSACSWELDEPEPVSKDNVTYWSFNFTLKSAPGHFNEFAKDNIQIRCRFYNTSATEEFDSEHSYTVAAGQLKFDFVVNHWEWNIDKLENFIEWLKTYKDVNITIPSYKTGLALWINMASIKLKDLGAAENETQSQNQETVETRSQMRAVNINGDYYTVSENKTQNEYEHQVRVTSRFRNRVRVQYANVEGNFSGFLEFVPWARLLNQTGDTVGYVNVTASYIAAGGHLRLFICYPYFGDYTLEHDPTVGLDTAQPVPTLVTPEMLIILLAATVVIGVAVAAVKLRKKTVNVVNIQ
ncbi:MAG: hypothetical protein ACP5IM_04945 [Candidatus Bathyarchaeia archaeon]